MGHQQVGHRRRVQAVAVHAHRQGLDAPQGEEAVERAGHAARRVLEEGQAGGQGVVVDHDRAAHHVGVPAQVLGRRVHHRVGAQRDRPLQVRRGERVVHDEQGACVAGQAGQRGDVRDAEQRVGRRLDPDHPGLAPGQRGPHRGRVVDPHRLVAHAPALVDLGEEPERSAVGVVGDEDVIAGRADGAEQAVFGGHAGGEGQRPGPPSSAARHCSSAVRVGLAEREYS